MILTKILGGAIAVLLLITALLFSQLKSATADAAQFKTERDQVVQTASELTSQIERMILESEQKDKLLADNRRKIARIIQDNSRLKEKINAVLRESQDTCAGMPVPPDAIRLLDGLPGEERNPVRVPVPEPAGANSGTHPSG